MRPTPHQWARGPAPALQFSLHEIGLLNHARRQGAAGVALDRGFPLSTALRLVIGRKGRIARGHVPHFIARSA